MSLPHECACECWNCCLGQKRRLGPTQKIEVAIAALEFYANQLIDYGNAESKELLSDLGNIAKDALERIKGQ